MSQKNDFSLYGLLSTISFIVRWVFCYCTIGQIDIFGDPVLNFIIPDGLIYVALLYVSYWTVKMVVVNKLRIQDKYIKCIAYFIFYFPWVLIMWGALAFFSWANVLPISR